MHDENNFLTYVCHCTRFVDVDINYSKRIGNGRWKEKARRRKPPGSFKEVHWKYLTVN